jgi:hypothetical protein
MRSLSPGESDWKAELIPPAMRLAPRAALARARRFRGCRPSDGRAVAAVDEAAKESCGKETERRQRWWWGCQA